LATSGTTVAQEGAELLERGPTRNPEEPINLLRRALK
jgi:hypothetical protein